MVSTPYIKINGVRYELDPDPETVVYQEVPQEIWQAPNQIGFWQSWVMRSWHGGERVTRILTADDLDKNTYDDGEGVDVSTWGVIKLQPALSRSLTISSATLPLCATNDGSAVLCGHELASSHYISRYSGNPGTWADIDTPSYGAVTDIITGKGQNMYAIQGYSLIGSADNGATWTTLSYGRSLSSCAVEATDNDATHVHLNDAASSTDNIYNDMKLVVLSGLGAGQIATVSAYNGTTRVATVSTLGTTLDATSVVDILVAATPTTGIGLAFCANQLFVLTADYLYYWDGADWQTAATWGGSCVCCYGEEVYWARDNRMYRYNGTSAYEVDRLPDGFTITGLFPYRNIMFAPGYYAVQGGKKGSVYYMLDGRDAHLFNIGSFDGSSDYTIKAVAGGDDDVYFANQKRGGADRYDLTKGGLSSGPAWGSAGAIPTKSMACHNGKLLVGRYDGVGGTDGVYVANIAITTAYRTSGWFTTPEMDFLFPTSRKLFNVISLNCRPLGTSETIKVEYSMDGGTSYTLAGYVQGIEVENKEFRVPNATGATIKVKATMTGPGTSTPEITLLKVDGQPMGEPMYFWIVALALWSSKGGRSAILELRKAYKSRSVLTFEDIYGEEHSVIIDQMPASIPYGSKWTAKVQIKLREV